MALSFGGKCGGRECDITSIEWPTAEVCVRCAEESAAVVLDSATDVRSVNGSVPSAGEGLSSDDVIGECVTATGVAVSVWCSVLSSLTSAVRLVTTDASNSQMLSSIPLLVLIPPSPPSSALSTSPSLSEDALVGVAARGDPLGTMGEVEGAPALSTASAALIAAESSCELLIPAVLCGFTPSTAASSSSREVSRGEEMSRAEDSAADDCCSARAASTEEFGRSSVELRCLSVAVGAVEVVTAGDALIGDD